MTPEIEYRPPTKIKQNLYCGFCGREFTEQLPLLGYLYPLDSDPTRRAGANACSECYPKEREAQIAAGLIVPISKKLAIDKPKKRSKIGDKKG